MKEEIKKILDIENYRNKDGYIENINLLPDEIHKLLDYITNLQEELEEQKRIEEKSLDKINNLQEENERLKETIENITTMTVNGDRKQIKNTAQYKLDIYKSRNEKAVKLVKENLMGIGYVEVSKLLNILEGGNNE